MTAFAGIGVMVYSATIYYKRWNRSMKKTALKENSYKLVS